MPAGWNSTMAVVGSFLAAFMLSMVPMREGMVAWWPAWPLLVLIYWCLILPQRVGILTAWIAGLLLDGVKGGALGQYALSMSLVAYLCLLSYRRWRHFTLVQFSGLMVGLVTLHQFTCYWLASITGSAGKLLPWLTVAIASMVAWMVVYPLLNWMTRLLRIERS